MMDSTSDDGENHNLAVRKGDTSYRVTYTYGRNTKHEDCDKNEEFTKKRNPVSRSSSGRLKRVVSCKRKTYHLSVARRKQLGSGRAYDAANKENEMNCLQDTKQEIFDLDHWEFPLSVNNNHKTGRTGSEQTDSCSLTELSRDHSTMINVLFGRHLRLKVSLTLWQRNVGELLTYFLRYTNPGHWCAGGFLPMITKSIEEDSPRINIGCCVDLFPLVRKLLSHPYEEYLFAGLKWINSVLINWGEELRASGIGGSTTDKNFQLFNQQLLEFWHQEPSMKSVSGAAGNMAKGSMPSCRRCPDGEKKPHKLPSDIRPAHRASFYSIEH